jgi:hypothetical protein
VSPERVGIIHRDTSGRYALSKGDPRSYQFLLITHEMIKSSRDVEQYTTLTADYEFLEAFPNGTDSRRSLVIYDESLIKSESRVQIGTSIVQAAAALASLKASAFTKSWPAELDSALDYLGSELPKVTRAYKRMLEGRETGGRSTLTLAPQDAEAINTWKRELNRFGLLDKNARATLCAFLEFSQEPIRLADLRAGQSSAGVLSFVIKIPSNIKNLVCLDASAAIRLLMHIDSQIEIIEDYADVKSFEKMTVEQLFSRGGNGYLKNLRSNSPHIKEIVHDLTQGWLPRGASVLICTKKGDKGKASAIDKIKQALVNAGVDLDAQIEHFERNSEHGRWMGRMVPKFNFITWGQERSTNDYRHCSHIIALGVLRRDILELAAQRAGQLEDLMHEAVTDRKAALETQVSEQFFCLQQLVGRGTSRQTSNGIAAPSWVRVYDQADFGDFIQKGLPGVKWIIRETGKYLKPVGQKSTVTKGSKLAESIIVWLHRNAPQSVLVAELRAVPQFASVNPKTFQRSLNAAVKAGCGYRRDSLKLVQVGHLSQ